MNPLIFWALGGALVGGAVVILLYQPPAVRVQTVEDATVNTAEGTLGSAILAALAAA